MKYSIALSILMLLASGCSHKDAKAKLTGEQKLLKDSANKLNDSIGASLQKGAYDIADARKKDLSAVHARLIAIQSSIDSLSEMK